MIHAQNICSNKQPNIWLLIYDGIQSYIYEKLHILYEYREKNNYINSIVLLTMIQFHRDKYRDTIYNKFRDTFIEIIRGKNSYQFYASVLQYRGIRQKCKNVKNVDMLLRVKLRIYAKNVFFVNDHHHVNLLNKIKLY